MYRSIVPGKNTIKNLLRHNKYEETVVIAPLFINAGLNKGEVAIIKEPCTVTDIKWEGKHGNEMEGKLIVYSLTKDSIIVTDKDCDEGEVNHSSLTYMGDPKSVAAVDMDEEMSRRCIIVNKTSIIPIWDLTYRDVKMLGFNSMEDLIDSWDAEFTKPGEKWNDCPPIYKIECCVTPGFASIK